MTLPTRPPLTPLGRLGDLAFRRRGRVVLAWIVALVAIVALAPAIAGEYGADYSNPGSESQRASDLIESRFPDSTGETVDVVWKADGGVRAAQVQKRMNGLIARAERLEGIGNAEPAQVSRDGTIALARLELDRNSWDVPIETGEQLIDMAEETSASGLQVELGGGVIQEAQEGAAPEMAGLLAAALILLIAFGSVVAAGLPILTALFGLGISASLGGVLALVADVPEWAPSVASLIGIGVGIDYALLILTRFRAALHRGSDRREAVVEAVSTAGRSVLVAGTTVVIAVLGLFVMGASYMNGVALAASLSVLVVMAAALTLLPAVLAFAGPRVDRLRIPGLNRPAAQTERHTLAARWSHAVQSRPWTAAIAAAAILLALTAPVMGLRLGFPDAGNDRSGTTTRSAYALVSEGFGPGANGTLLLAAELSGPDDRAAIERVAANVRNAPGVAAVSPPRINSNGDAAVIRVQPTTTPQASETTDLVHRLRDDVIPAATRGTGTQVDVGGLNAVLVDQSDQVSSRLPLFVAAVVGLSFLLLTAAFRAPLIALKAGVMNLLSIGAAYGVVALVAQGGFVGSLIGIDTNTPVPPFIPVMMFAILFGLSMDYEVFLLSRVREEYLENRSTSRAVADGLAKTARVITAAAAIMVAVFMSFVLSSEPFLKLMGVGMATAIFVDATIVRMVLVPAVMQLMGRANWWIPGWLDRALPRIGITAQRASMPSEATP
jgi:putative drug exporter of the RND superfamily